MNTGLVSSRYALALLKYVSGTEDEEKVYSQVLRLSGSLSAVPELRELIDNPLSVSDTQKFSLLVSALDGEEMAQELKKFILLVMKNRRTRFLRLIFQSFISQYREAHKIKLSRLIGGFIFDIDGYRMDASVASQLKSVRRQFIEKNRRIV